LKEELRIERLLNDLDPLIRGTLEGAERVRDLVQDLRRFSSGQQGERVDFDLVHVVRTAVHWVTKEAGRGLDLRLDLPERLEINGHPGQIHQVIMNLVQNAVDATMGVTGPQLLISLRERPGWVRLAVEDNGPGIPAADLTRIFDPFFTTKPVGQGTGLGLSISDGIVRDHGGALAAQPGTGGCGARLVMELPR
jgi:two-component system sensor histidine kinase HupT/HoxJ